MSIKVQTVKLRRPGFDLVSGLAKSPTLPWVPVAVNSAAALESVRREAPVDGREVVEWMLWAASDRAVFEGMCEEYNSLGSELLSGSGDPYIPGVRVGDLRGVSVTGRTVMSRGYGEVWTPRGKFKVRVGGKALYANRDILAWAALPWCKLIQWVLTLLQWRSLATLPVRRRVRFASSHGMVAPNFFSYTPRAVPPPVLTLRIGLTSDKPQTVAIKGRGTKGSYHQVLFEDKVSIDKGESEIIFNVFGAPWVQPFTLEIQPQDGTQTVLDYIEVFPPI